MRLAVTLLLLFAFVAPAPAPAQSEAERERLDWAVQRGRLLFEIDRAAWVTTDDLLARMPDPASTDIRGWVVEPDGAGFVVTYYAPGDDGRLHAAYRGRVEDRRVESAQLFPAGARPPLTPAQHRLAAARGVVARMDRRPCVDAPFNVAVIPPEQEDGPADVYALTPQLDRDVFPFGGHFRATVSPSGEILSQRDFTRSCLAMPRDRNPDDRSVALMVTHLLDPTPTEIHVFLATWIGLPVFVGTSEGRVWEVREDGIRLVEPD